MKQAIRQLAEHPVLSAFGISIVLSSVADVVRAAKGVPTNPGLQISTSKPDKK